MPFYNMFTDQYFKPECGQPVNCQSRLCHLPSNSPGSNRMVHGFQSGQASPRCRRHAASQPRSQGLSLAWGRGPPPSQGKGPGNEIGSKLIRYSCKGVCTRCKCSKVSLECTPLCKIMQMRDKELLNRHGSLTTVHGKKQNEACALSNCPRK